MLDNCNSVLLIIDIIGDLLSGKIVAGLRFYSHLKTENYEVYFENQSPRGVM